MKRKTPRPPIRPSIERAIETVRGQDLSEDEQLTTAWKTTRRLSPSVLKKRREAEAAERNDAAERRARDEIQRRQRAEQLWQRRLEETHYLENNVNEALVNPIDEARLQEASRKYFQHAAGMFRECARQARTGTLDIAAPGSLFAAASHLFDDLGRGRIPKVVSAVSARGNTPWGAGEAVSIGYAIAYLHYVRSGKIADRFPTKTIQDAYGVTRKAVQKWGQQDIPALVRESCEDLEGGPDFENWLRFKITDNGLFYQKWGRGLTGLKAREAKRKT